MIEVLIASPLFSSIARVVVDDDGHPKSPCISVQFLGPQRGNKGYLHISLQEAESLGHAILSEVARVRQKGVQVVDLHD